MSAARWQEPNLSLAPFVNERPVRRLAATCWVLFVLVAAGGFWMSQKIRRETGAQVVELSRLSTATADARARAGALETELRAANLPAQNERTEFLNRRIAERSFSWNRLLETVTREMPRGVRLARLSPEGFSRGRQRLGDKRESVATTRVALRIAGEAEETEALLEFVDRLYRNPAFAHPNLSRQSERKDSMIQFDLAVDYLPTIAGEIAAGASALTTTLTTTPAGGTTRPSLTAGSGLAGRGAGNLAPAASGSAGSAGGALGAEAGAKSAPGVAIGTFPLAGRDARTARDPNAGGARGSAYGDGAGEPNEGLTPEESKRLQERADLGAAGQKRQSPGDAAALGNRFPPGGSSGNGGNGNAGGNGENGSGATPRKFPFDVLPTPLKPYASTAGGGR
ncbi:MAG: hypothetical protein ABI639_12920 [Thermoanaerobaculia bacterium]